MGQVAESVGGVLRDGLPARREARGQEGHHPVLGDGAQGDALADAHERRAAALGEHPHQVRRAPGDDEAHIGELVDQVLEDSGQRPPVNLGNALEFVQDEGHPALATADPRRGTDQPLRHLTPVRLAGRPGCHGHPEAVLGEHQADPRADGGEMAPELLHVTLQPAHGLVRDRRGETLGHLLFAGAPHEPGHADANPPLPGGDHRRLQERRLAEAPGRREDHVLAVGHAGDQCRQLLLAVGEPGPLHWGAI
jgi:hypothetical protein